MDSKKNITTLLDTVEKSLATATFRNAYEANNTHASNIERLDSAASVLKNVQLSAAEIDILQRRIVSLRSLNDDVVKNHGAAKVISAADEWLKQLEQNADEEDEDALVEQLAAKKKKEKKEKKEKKDKREKEKESKTVERSPAAPAPREHDDEAEEKRKRDAEAAPEATVLFAAPNCGFVGLPLEALAGRCVVKQIPNTPCVELRYDIPAPVPTSSSIEDGKNKKKNKGGHKKDAEENEKNATAQSQIKGTVVAVMYRVVVAALWKGVPALSPIHHHQLSKHHDKHSNQLVVNKEAKDDGVGEERKWKYGEEKQESLGESETKAKAEEEEKEQTSADADTENENGHEPDADDAVNAEENEEEEEEEDIIEEQHPEDDDNVVVDNTLREYSEKLVQEYNEAQAEDDADQFSRGRDAPSQITIPTTHFRHAFEAPWTVLICHGGYFAGAVFINGKAIVHKAFQRYVVRKGQGGLQSKADKTGGIAKSVGSQIRRHNELKWKVMVRDILLGWKGHIDASWIILYVAPGPENRSILTDFGNIPASFGGGTGKGAAKSPIDMKDIRVRSAPLTTHRPTYTEVQRIYHEVSRVSVRYEETCPQQQQQQQPQQQE